LHEGYPWDLLRTFHPDVTYVVVTANRRHELAELLGCSPERIQVVYNGVDPRSLLGPSDEGWQLVKRLELLEAELRFVFELGAYLPDATNILAYRAVCW
jgi:hypothetical protein